MGGEVYGGGNRERAVDGEERKRRSGGYCQSIGAREV